MSRHLKNIVMDHLADTIATFVQLPPGSTPHTKGVRYFRTVNLIERVWGAFDPVKEGQRRKKRIVARPSRFRKGLFELYTYHFPKTWSAACVANRELIKEAQRKAHALEHDHTPEGLEWRIRFFEHYFRVFRCHQAPEPGMKRYSRFYQYTYVCLYRELQAAQRQALQSAENQSIQQQEQQPQELAASSFAQPSEDISFVPIRPTLRRRNAAHRAFLSSAFDDNFILKPRSYLIC